MMGEKTEVEFHVLTAAILQGLEEKKTETRSMLTMQ